jgi:hypothetical protein
LRETAYATVIAHWSATKPRFFLLDRFLSNTTVSLAALGVLSKEHKQTAGPGLAKENLVALPTAMVVMVGPAITREVLSRQVPWKLAFSCSKAATHLVLRSGVFPPVVAFAILRLVFLATGLTSWPMAPFLSSSIAISVARVALFLATNRTAILELEMPT